LFVQGAASGRRSDATNRTARSGGTLILYHITSAANAQNILINGFRDGRGRYMTDREWSGVWLSDFPMVADAPPEADRVLQVELNLSEKELAEWEWIEDGKGYREWLIPSAVLNANGRVRIEE
jgi:hypothetical protein